MKPATARALLLVAVAAAGLIAGYMVAATRSPGPSPVADVPGALWPPARSVPDIRLVDQQGGIFDRARLQGKWSVLFFGYTHCPDVCPTTLAEMAAVRRELSRGEAVPVQLVFVTVDPERDPPDRLGEYAAYFDPAIVAVGGERPALDRLTRALGILAVRNPADEHGDYLVDHTASLLLLDPDARLVGVFSPPHQAASVAGRIRRIVEALS